MSPNLISDESKYKKNLNLKNPTTNYEKIKILEGKSHIITKGIVKKIINIKNNFLYKRFYKNR